MLHISKRTLQHYRDDGLIPFIKLEWKILFRESDIIKVLEDNYQVSRLKVVNASILSKFLFN
ncbi:helix-turn-helix domain-containing protein [Epilithonimonas mollis]|nr:helix-turn-helix domain-containing protein [Epilithonimonas mollis]